MGRNGDERDRSAAPIVVTASTVRDAEAAIEGLLGDNELILVKGSRALALERLLPVLGVEEDSDA